MGLGVPGGKVRKGKRRGWEGQENEGKASRGEEGKFHTTIFFYCESYRKVDAIQNDGSLV